MDEFRSCVGLLLVLTFNRISGLGNLWSEWWTYSTVSGPNYWGIHNPEWSICNKGKYQSPINIEPKHLIHDPNMSPLSISRHPINGFFINNGHDLALTINDTKYNPFIITGGPLSYKYTLYDIRLHFGLDDEKGSEHTIGGKRFPLEIQFYGFNHEIHKNSSSALNSPHGIVALSVLAQVSNVENEIVTKLIELALQVRLKGWTVPVEDFSVNSIIPSTDSFLAYEGSLTRPGCMETVTWIILNKPIPISHIQLESLRSLTYQDGSGQTLMENNFRILTPSYGRLIRTNIKPKAKVDDCYNVKLTSYEVNKRFKEDV